MKWHLRNGRVISDKKMTQNRLGTADLYDGKVKGPLPVTVNHRLAQRFREMTNQEFSNCFGLANRTTN